MMADGSWGQAARTAGNSARRNRCRPAAARGRRTQTRRAAQPSIFAPHAPGYTMELELAIEGDVLLCRWVFCWTSPKLSVAGAYSSSLQRGLAPLAPAGVPIGRRRLNERVQ
jgi:hypothetical protein